MVATDELLVGHAAVGENHRSPCLDPYAGPERQARPKHHRVQQITFKSQVSRHGTIVERTRQGRDEIHMAGGTALEKTASRDFDDYLYLWWICLWWICRCRPGLLSEILRVNHAAILLLPAQRAWGKGEIRETDPSIPREMA